MRPLILLAFIAIPVAEIALFIEVGSRIGTAWTVALIVLTAVIGVSLLKRQGLTTWRTAQSELNQGHMPIRQVFDGACLLVAGAFLLTPGFFTDALGFSLLVPAVRSALLGAFKSLPIGAPTVIVRRSDQPFDQAPPRHSYDVEGEFTEISPESRQDR